MSDVEIPMCFESAHIVPILFLKKLHFITLLLIGPRGPSQATRLSWKVDFLHGAIQFKIHVHVFVLHLN